MLSVSAMIPPLAPAKDPSSPPQLTPVYAPGYHGMDVTYDGDVLIAALGGKGWVSDDLVRKEESSAVQRSAERRRSGSLRTVGVRAGDERLGEVPRGPEDHPLRVDRRGDVLEDGVDGPVEADRRPLVPVIAPADADGGAGPAGGDEAVQARVVGEGEPRPGLDVGGVRRRNCEREGGEGEKEREAQWP